MTPSDLQPAVVDPAKLRRTAWILVAIMIVGGSLIYLAYQKMASAQSMDNRPAMIHEIRPERDLTVVKQDGKTAKLLDLRGQVVLLHCISASEPETSRRSSDVMKRFAAMQPAMPGVQLVTLLLDPPDAGESVAMLARTAESHDMKLPGWWLATTERKTLHKFVKNELKAGIYPHEENGRMVFDTSVFLIDREGRLRRAVVPQQRGGQPYVATFDFDQAAAWDAKGIKTGTALNNQDQLEKLLRETIGILLAETTPTP